MSRTSANWVVCIFGILATLIGGIAWHVGAEGYRAMHAFSVEDRIHATFFPVTQALYRYAEEQGHPAKTLGALLPKYLDALPTSPLTDALNYSVAADGQTWELSIHSRTLPHPRLYVCRSSQQYAPEEMRRVIFQYHVTWTVFRADH